MTQTTFRTSILSALAVLALAACSGGADTSPTDVPEPASVNQPLSAPPPASPASTAASTANDGKHCDGHGKRDPAAFLKRFDKNGDGKLEVSELPDKMQAFLAKADTNGDGILSPEELAANRLEMRKEYENPVALIKRFDKNGDGKLEVSEVPAPMQKWIGKVDTNNDGIITADEITAARTAMEKARFAKKDKNGDGVLTADEVGPRKWEHLKVADTDNNGSVTLAEVDQAIAAGTLPTMMGHGFHHHHGDRCNDADPGSSAPVQPQKS